VSLLDHFDWEGRAMITRALAGAAKAGCRVLGAAVIGAGIGFVQGAVVDASQPNMVQDGGALSGAIVGCAIGFAALWRRFEGPESASIYGFGVTVCLACGLVAAKLLGIASLLVTPVVALIILSVLSARNRVRTQTTPELDPRATGP
jgi:hypothetical protein